MRSPLSDNRGLLASTPNLSHAWRKAVAEADGLRTHEKVLAGLGLTWLGCGRLGEALLGVRSPATPVARRGARYAVAAGARAHTLRVSPLGRQPGEIAAIADRLQTSSPTIVQSRQSVDPREVSPSALQVREKLLQKPLCQGTHRRIIIPEEL